MKKKNITELFLKNIVDSLNYNNLPFEWANFNLSYFSKNKKLYDYQQNAIKNAIKILYKYFYEYEQDKEKLFNLYKYNGLNANFNLKLNNKIIKDYYATNEVHFSNLVNRMNFWMATGSGKTLVIVKLLEILTQYIKNDLIPNYDILFLTHREDLIEQFKNHLNEFNFSYEIHNLKDYEKVKMENKKINIFYYRSDLISDEQKDSIINFRNYDNNGKMYIILDEAHKGNKEDSKRQNYYTILSRNGFLFNFSATFTDEIDFITCVYNFNLKKFIEEGYGKNIFISKDDLTELSKKTDFSAQEKQIIILKIFLLFALIKKYKIENYYHKPLLLTLVNSVNTIDSDLYFLFKEIENISLNNNNEELLEIAKNKLIEELKIEDEDLIKKLTYKDILINVFNANIPSNIEVIKIPNNNQEFALKFKSSDKPFALIKIGDITKWIKEKLNNYEIIEKFDNESFFKKINENDSDINILMGSRAFYEGWDSNRPNIILFINIGKGADAKKFVLQSVGRGVRIEPIPFKKRRLQFLFNSNEITEEIYNKLKNNTKFLETLYIFGTKAKNLKDIFEMLKDSKDEKILVKTQTLKPEFDLLIPTYETIDEKIKNLKFEINNKDFELFKNYFNYIGEKIFLVKYECDDTLFKIKKSLENIDEYYNISNSNIEIKNIDFLTKKIIQFFSINPLILKGFKKLENEINHFNNIRILKNKNYQSINIQNHLYNPIILDENKTSINTIQIKSEIEFINTIKNSNGLLFNKFENWFFSKISENDNVYIPYSQPKTNKIEKFKPDFIFWAKDNDKYYIIFIDPKGTEHTDAIRKIDGFINFVEKRNNNKNIIVKLFMKVNDINKVTEKYREYYFDDFNKSIL